MTAADPQLNANTVREALAIAWPEGDHAEPNAFTEALAALDALQAQAETGDRLLSQCGRKLEAAEQRATDMEKALRQIWDVPPGEHLNRARDIARAALSAREEACEHNFVIPGSAGDYQCDRCGRWWTPGEISAREEAQT